MKKIAKKPWFGKRRVGWGLIPISWQGWVVTLILILIILLDVVYLYNATLYFYNSDLFNIILMVAVICYMIVALLTSPYLEVDTD